MATGRAGSNDWAAARSGAERESERGRVTEGERASAASGAERGTEGQREKGRGTEGERAAWSVATPRGGGGRGGDALPPRLDDVPEGSLGGPPGGGGGGSRGGGVRGGGGASARGEGWGVGEEGEGGRGMRYISDLTPEMWDREHDTRKWKHGSWTPEPETRTLSPKTQSRIPDLKPENSSPYL